MGGGGSAMAKTCAVNKLVHCTCCVVVWLSSAWRRAQRMQFCSSRGAYRYPVRVFNVTLVQTTVALVSITSD